MHCIVLINPEYTLFLPLFILKKRRKKSKVDIKRSKNVSSELIPETLSRRSRIESYGYGLCNNNSVYVLSSSRLHDSSCPFS